MLEQVLAEFGVKGQIDQVRPGPVVTLYELVPAAGVKSSRVIALADDIARSMSARACRVSVVQGRNAIGIELPNATARDRLSALAAFLARVREGDRRTADGAGRRHRGRDLLSQTSPRCPTC